MKKVMLSLVAILSAISLVSCEVYDNAIKKEEAKNEAFNSYFNFVVVTKKTNHAAGKAEYIYVDKNTKVLYYVVESTHSYGITPILNSDGTPKLYEKDLTE